MSPVVFNIIEDQRDLETTGRLSSNLIFPSNGG